MEMLQVDIAGIDKPKEGIVFGEAPDTCLRFFSEGFKTGLGIIQYCIFNCLIIHNLYF